MPDKSTLTYLDFDREVRSGNLKQVYFISAADNYFLDKAGKLIRTTLSGSENNKENYFIRYADETGIDEIIDFCYNYTSLFSENKIVIVKRCEKLSRKLDDLVEYSDHPVEGTYLMLVFDKEYVTEKKLDKQLSFYDFSNLPDNEFRLWIQKEFEMKGFKIGDEELSLFISSVPRNFDLIENEIMKLTSYYDPEKNQKEQLISREVILKFIGYETEYTPYELIQAILRKDGKKSLKILDFLLNKGSINPVFLVSVLNGYYLDLFAFNRRNLADRKGINHGQYPLWGDKFNIVRTYSKALKISQLNKIFEKILETDLKLKSSMIEPDVLLTTLVQQLIDI